MKFLRFLMMSVLFVAVAGQGVFAGDDAGKVAKAEETLTWLTNNQATRANPYEHEEGKKMSVSPGNFMEGNRLKQKPVAGTMAAYYCPIFRDILNFKEPASVEKFKLLVAAAIEKQVAGSNIRDALVLVQKEKLEAAELKRKEEAKRVAQEIQANLEKDQGALAGFMQRVGKGNQSRSKLSERHLEVVKAQKEETERQAKTAVTQSLGGLNTNLDEVKAKILALKRKLQEVPVAIEKVGKK